jgi:hypothetical protein
MNRQLIVAGLVGLGLLLFVFIVATMAAPSSRPILDGPNNDSFDYAEPISVPGVVNNGVLTWTESSGSDLQDYYIMTTTVGSYEASLIVGYSETGMDADMSLYRSDRLKVPGGGPATSLSWSSSTTTTFYIRVDASPGPTSTNQSVTYNLYIDKIAPTDVPPTTAPPTAVSSEDPYEQNNFYTQTFDLPVTTHLELGDYLGVATFHTLDPNRDEDWYRFWAKNNKWYQITTSELNGVDTRVVIRDKNNHNVTSNDDGGGGYASLASFEASYDGYYYIRVHNKVNALGSYNMTLDEIDEPEPGATVTPGPGPDSKTDSCEENADFGTACVIAANDPKKFNFVPPYGGVDNDFFKLWIKPGYNYECFTADLDAGVDPNMIVFTGPSWDNAIGGNDDVEPGDFNSYFAYYAAYEGWLYILVGYGDRTPSDVYNSNYTLECKVSMPGSPTAVPTSPTTSTPRPSSAPPTATPFEGLTIRQLTTPTPVPQSPSGPSFVMINLLVYYDANGDSQPGAGEGVKGVAVQAYDVKTGELLAQGITDELGHIEFTVTAQGPVRVAVPFFGFSQIVAGEEAVIRLRVPSRPLSEGGP